MLAPDQANGGYIRTDVLHGVINGQTSRHATWAVNVQHDVLSGFSLSAAATGPQSS